MPHIARTIVVRLALILMGAGLAVAGVAMLMRAVWLAVAAMLGPIWASTVLGGVLLLAGAIAVLLSARQRRRPALSDTELISLIAKAFLDGLSAGRSTGHRPDSDKS